MKLSPLVAAFAALVVGTTLAAPAVADPEVPEPSAPPTRPAPSSIPLVDDVSDRALAALAHVEELLTGPPAGPDTTAGRNPQQTDLTAALRQLSLLKDELPAAQQEEAEDYFARPTDPDNRRCPDVSCYTAKSKRTCSDVICVHWVPKQRDRRNGVPTADRDDDGIPNYVERTEKEMTHVHETYVASGWRPPKSDGDRGGNAKPDVYLAQIGHRFYGYCTTDDRNPPEAGGTWGYCVLDNDYRRKEFPVHTPIENLQVTAAHEYLHNVQFGYDYGEDDWLYEATATWAEDVLYDHVNDNAYYLPYGPIRELTTPLDTFTGLYHYGAWIFFRYLTDRYGGVQGSMPDLVLRIWQQADAVDGPNQYSLQAIQTVLAEEGTELADEYAAFAAGNRRPELTYAEEFAELEADEDDDVRYPRSPLQATLKVRADQPAVERSVKLDHLTPRTFRLKPAGGLTGQDLHLEFDVLDSGGRVVVTRKEAGVDPVSQLVELATDGTGTLTSPFGSGVDWVEVTLVNGSDRMRCGRGIFSCDGNARDDNERHAFSADLQPAL